jgi:hypothetical protein
LLQSWTSGVLWLLVGSIDGTLSRIQVFNQQVKSTVTVGNQPVVLTRLQNSIIYCNCNQDGILTQDCSFERITKTIFYEQAVDHLSSGRLISITNLFDHFIYLIERPHGQVGVQFGSIDTTSDQVRWISTRLGYSNMTVELVQSCFDRSSGYFVVIANARSSVIDETDRGIMFVVGLNHDTGGDLRVIFIYDFSTNDITNGTKVKLVEERTSVVHVVQQIHVGEDDLIVVACTIGSICSLEYFSINQFVIKHVKSVQLGIAFHEMVSFRVVSSRDALMVILFNNMLHVVHTSIDLQVKLMHRVELIDYALSLESNDVFEYQTYLNQSSSYYRSLFFNIVFFDVFEIEQQVFIIVNGFMYGTKILLLEDNCAVKEIVDFRHDKMILSSIMVSATELICSYKDGTVIKYKIEKVQVERKKRSYERTGHVWKNQFEDGFDQIVDKLNDFVNNEDKFLLMGSSDGKSTFQVRRLEHKLQVLDEIKHNPLSLIRGGMTDTQTITFVSTKGEIGLVHAGQSPK